MNNSIELTTRYCFRCKGMAVLDPAHLSILPTILSRAQLLLTKAQFQEGEEEEVWKVINGLQIYANMLDSINIGD